MQQFTRNHVACTSAASLRRRNVKWGDVRGICKAITIKGNVEREAGNFNEKLLHLIWIFQHRSPPFEPIHMQISLSLRCNYTQLFITLILISHCVLLNAKHDKNET